MLFYQLFEGGIWAMLPIYILGIAVVVLTVILAYTTTVKRMDDTNRLKRMRETILFLGSFALLWGILGQVVGLMQIMDIVEREGDVPSFLIAGGLKVSLIPPLYGFILFLMSLVVWFVSRTTGRRLS